MNAIFAIGNKMYKQTFSPVSKELVENGSKKYLSQYNDGHHGQQLQQRPSSRKSLLHHDPSQLLPHSMDEK